MRLSEIKNHLHSIENVHFQLQNGDLVPAHFHVTEIGVLSKHFIDCGGTVRTEKTANLQLWNANDYDHRLEPSKLLNIISLCEQKLMIEDLEIEVEYQTETIGKYGLAFENGVFILTNTKTACLASDACGVLPNNTIIEKKEAVCCTPGGGCC
jgi:hypothetical protein